MQEHTAAPMFPHDTNAGIARVMLDGAAPAAIYVAEHCAGSPQLTAVVGVLTSGV
ncbi:hypothetical protein [Streptomyces sp. NPDC058108]|uniref:hypothetical protein n=1 Tax=Streptomyces sp. NPDC058108 TaxID=3346344 RepID=UPI0036E71394